jgi:hypothetical protein
MATCSSSIVCIGVQMEPSLCKGVYPGGGVIPGRFVENRGGQLCSSLQFRVGVMWGLCSGKKRPKNCILGG